MTAEIDMTKCVYCGACRVLCPAKAIERLPGGDMVVHAESCTGCGRCVNRCYGNAIVLTGEQHTEL